jgi:PTS system nitrogen regulatory IIA component
MNIQSKEAYLNIEEVALLLDLPEVTIQRWAHQGKIPYKIISGKTIFKKSEITRWANAHDLAIKEKKGKPVHSGSENLLTDAIRAGGIYRHIPGDDIYSVFENALEHLDFIKKSDHKKVFEELLNREELASTGIGHGIAIPHTRNRLDLNLQHAHIAVFFLQQPVIFNAIDGQPVQIMFMIFTSTVKEHLKMLSKISYVLQQPSFRENILSGISDEDLIGNVKQIEHEAH